MAKQFHPPKSAWADSTFAPGRANSKVGDVVTRLRTAILSGEYLPGSRLQTYDELEPILAVSRATLRCAIRRLKEEGFVESQERSHMYVSARPPHMFRYGLALREPSTNNRFDESLCLLARQNTQADSEFVVYQGIFPGSEHPDWERLRQDIRSHRLAGLIVRSQSEYLAGTGALECPELPKVAIREDHQHGFYRLKLDNQSLTDQAVNWFLSQGRRKIAIIASGLSIATKCFETTIQTYGLDIRPEWRIYLALDYPQTARNVAVLLTQLSPDRRPDSLLIADDNYAEYVCAGLSDAGIRVPHDIAVVTHCNWLGPNASRSSIVRFGFDVREVLFTARDMLWRARRGEAVSDTMIPARSETVLSSSTS